MIPDIDEMLTAAIAHARQQGKNTTLFSESLAEIRALRNKLNRSCTCHPDDNPPVPCAGNYAMSECRNANQHDIADECEHRMDEHYSVHSSINCKSVNVAELHADLARYAAHMRRQEARIEKLKRLVQRAIPCVPYNMDWITEAKEILK